jgi:hypothetical protein
MEMRNKDNFSTNKINRHSKKGKKLFRLKENDPKWNKK